MDNFPYKVSTITATGSMNGWLNLDVLYEHLEVIEKDSPDPGCLFVEYGHKKSDTYYKGFNKKLLVNRRKTTQTKRFDNQVTVVLRLAGAVPHPINVKIFKNGNVQMTGLRTIEQGQAVIDTIIRTVGEIHAHKDPSICDDPKALTATNYRVRLINCDFRIGYEVKRDKLYKIIQQKYNTFCSFEPCIYPGVKIQYHWNLASPTSKGGCFCEVPCNGKGTGEGEGQCKKITIAVFQSGCVIITGAQTHAQISTAYDFITGVFKKHMPEIQKLSPAHA